MICLVDFKGEYTSDLAKCFFGTIRFESIMIEVDRFEDAYPIFLKIRNTIQPPYMCKWSRWIESIRQTDRFYPISQKLTVAKAAEIV